MRQLVGLLVVICGCGFAAAQNDQVLPGAYAQPFAPRLATPSASPEALATPTLTLHTPHLTVGASTGTLSAAGSPCTSTSRSGMSRERGLPRQWTNRQPRLRQSPLESLVAELNSGPPCFRAATASPNWRVRFLGGKRKGSIPTRTLPVSTTPMAGSSFVSSWNTQTRPA